MYNQLTTLKERIDHSEDLINIQLDARYGNLITLTPDLPVFRPLKQLSSRCTATDIQGVALPLKLAC